MGGGQGCHTRVWVRGGQRRADGPNRSASDESRQLWNKQAGRCPSPNGWGPNAPTVAQVALPPAAHQTCRLCVEGAVDVTGR